MDARVNGVPVTPRLGKPVEVNALWINALDVLAGLRDKAGTDPSPVRAEQARATGSFHRRYPGPDGYLLDVLDPDDGRLRPNQLLAYSLPGAPLHGRPVPAALHPLLTPLGLRTLPPDASGYQGRHRGDPASRDEAYHEGTVWPWLIGPYADALRASGRPTGDLLTGLTAHLREYGLGSVSETADGDPPHGATGCPFQAWSVAEVLRLIHVALRI
jgi:predicted glycogen debranching enzyme